MAKGKFEPLPRGIREPVCFALGGIIREERLRRGWSQTKLAKISGLRRQGIAALETNRSLARVETAQRIGRAFGLKGSVLTARAEQRVAGWPEQCLGCNYCCISHGRLKWLNDHGECFRPKR